MKPVLRLKASLYSGLFLLPFANYHQMKFIIAYLLCAQMIASGMFLFAYPAWDLVTNIYLLISFLDAINNERYVIYGFGL